MTSAAILCGGHARRLGGQDKRRLLVGGRTILTHQLEALGPCVSRIFVVGGVRPAPEEWLGNTAVQAVPDRVAERGPLGGLDAALDAAGNDAVLLLACDLPYVTTALLSHLIRVCDGADAAVPRTERGYHPLCAVYAQSCATAVRHRLEHGMLRMRDLLGDLRVRTVELEELRRYGAPERLLANINTYADLDALGSLSH
ncbi:MAG: molybdenum cofactor guanylyltransferase [Vicinamibacterales bacterium]